jgi:3-hydroxyacyl-[acyl-carrier-protein] dehydratase
LETFGIQKIQQILPHRYPFLLVDRVVEIELGKRIRAYKNVTFNEPFFTGHFPGHPVMPGVLVVEAMAQAVALLAYESEPFDMSKSVIYLTGIDGARFRRPVVPGDRVDFVGTIVKRKGPIWKLECEATVDGERVAEAELMATLADR